MSSLHPPYGVESLTTFLRDVSLAQSEMGTVRGVLIYDQNGTQLRRFDNFTAPREDLFAVTERAAAETKGGRDTWAANAHYAGLFATRQPEPSGGSKEPVERTMGKFIGLLSRGGLTLLHWVELWDDEVRIPEPLARLHLDDTPSAGRAA